MDSNNSVISSKSEQIKKNQIGKGRTVKTADCSSAATFYGNKVLRLVVDGDPVTAKEIWLNALTCREGWVFDVKGIARHHNINAFQAERLLKRLVKAGLAFRRVVVDPTNKIKRITYTFYRPKWEGGK